MDVELRRGLFIIGGLFISALSPKKYTSGVQLMALSIMFKRLTDGLDNDNRPAKT